MLSKSYLSPFFFFIVTIVLLLSGVNARGTSAVPHITSVSSTSGIPLSNTVTITGAGFNDTAAGNCVYFGAVRATVNTATTTQLNVTVPVGALYTNIFVLNLTTGLSCHQQGFFTPYYDNSCYVSGSNLLKPQANIPITGTSSPHNGPRHTAMGDMDGDGKADLVVSTYDTINAGHSAVFVYRNISANGQILYASPVICTSAPGGTNVKLADLDGDGRLDIIVACSGSGVVSCIRNTTTAVGALSFATKKEVYPLSGTPEVAIADFDGDGRMDIAAVSYATATVKIFHNEMTSVPTGAFPTDFFGAYAAFDSFSVGSYSGAYPGSIFAADFDGDGKVDIVTSNTYDASVSVLRNTSSSGSFSFNTHIDYSIGGAPTEVQVADMDGDGKPEIIVADFFSNSVAVFANNSTSGTINTSSFSRFDYATKDSSYGLNVADLDGDGKTDIVISRGKANSISIIRNTNATGSPLSSSSFAALTTYATGAGAESQGFCIGDIDGDTKPDIAVANYNNNTISIFKNSSTPVSAPIIGVDSLCLHAVETLTSNHCTGAAGYWSVTNSHASIVGGIGIADTAAVITGLSAGVDTVVYAVVYLTDTTLVKYVVNIKSLADTGIITGVTNVCVGAAITLADTAISGTWSSSNTLLATVDTAGRVVGLAPGNVVINYTVASLSCGSLSAAHSVTINALPDAGTISGANGTCVGSSISLTASTAGGTWYNTNLLNVLATPSGVNNLISGLNVGTDTILYVVTTPLCGEDTAVKPIGILSTGVSLPIFGDTITCVHDTVQLSNGANGGLWTSSDLAVASVDGVTGKVIALGAGTTTILYSVSYTCGLVDTFIHFTVNPSPDAGVISGATYMCLGSQTTLTVTGANLVGSWSTSNSAVATIISSSGIATGVGLGTDTLFYTVSNSCGTATSFILDTVRAFPPIDSITGAHSICPATTLSLSSTGGGVVGTWASSDNTIVTVAAGVVTGVNSGTAIISYSVSTACGVMTDTAAILVYPHPSLSSLSDQAVCNGGTNVTIFNGTVAGSTFSWTNNNTTIGLGASGTGDTIIFVGTNTTDSVVSASVIVVPSANGCIGANDTFTISVEPTPMLSGTLSMVPICDSTVFNYVPASSTAAVTYLWRRAAVTGIANLAANGTDSTNEVLVNTTNLPIVVTYVYTLTVNGCTNTQNVTVTVNPKPKLTSSLTPADLCSDRLFSYSPAGNIIGAMFSWHRPSVAGINNLPASGTDNPNEILYNTTTAFVNVPYSFTTTAYGCSNTEIVTVKVQPKPILNGVTRDTLCSGTPFNFTGTVNVPSTTISWTRAAVTGITPATGTGSNIIRDTLNNSTFTRLNAIYVFVLSANGCTYNQNVVLTVDPLAAPAPVITTHSPSALCSNTQYQNFGTAFAPADTAVQYVWTATNATVFATGSSDQYSLVNFPDPGNAVIRVTANVKGINCFMNDSFAVNVSSAVSDRPSVLYFNHNQFVCLPSDEDTYQWGYDDAQLDSTIITGEVNQDYINPSPDFSKYYWVITTRNGCMQKTYYTAPVGVQDVNGIVVAMNIYPNPADQQVTVDVSGINTTGMELEIYNVIGQKVAIAALNNNKAVINVADLASGAYVVGCYNKGIKMATARFIKN